LTSFFPDAPPTTHLYTLSLHDALPIFDQIRVVIAAHVHPQLVVPPAPQRDELLGHDVRQGQAAHGGNDGRVGEETVPLRGRDWRSEEPRLNSSHLVISYAVFCLKKKK